MTKELALAILLTAISTYAVGADVSLQKDSSGNPIVNISGTIAKGDLVKVKKASAALIRSLSEYSNKPLQFHLNTPGGDLEEAMQIGRFARQLLVKIDSYGKIIIASQEGLEELFNEPDKPWKHRDFVILRPDVPLSEKHIVRNYSAGILIFYGATMRAHRDNSDQRQGFYKAKSIPVMGIHRPYYDKGTFSELPPNEAARAYSRLEASVRSYLVEMGAPQQLIDRMFNRASTDIDLIPADEFRRYYKIEESFLEEWLIAKCGSPGYENILTGTTLDDFITMQKEQVRSRIEDKDHLGIEVGYLYPNEKFPQDYVEALYRKVRTYNRSVDFCRDKAISVHQREWVSSYR